MCNKNDENVSNIKGTVTFTAIFDQPQTGKFNVKDIFNFAAKVPETAEVRFLDHGGSEYDIAAIELIWVETI